MKNKKNVVMAVAILVAVLALGIGYALGTQTLTVNGTAKAKTTDQFDVSFNGTTDQTYPTDGTATASAAAQSKTGTCTVELKTVGSEATCTFEFQNYSPAGINAQIDASKLAIYDSTGNAVWTNTGSPASSEYFNIEMTESWTGTPTLTPGDTEDFTFKVSLKKANVSDEDVTETFVVKLTDITAVQA